ncbi:hypothetical protein VTN00DRAFT_6284 [Thermoascus crustaceus]|uniref:uncharacterized protein n=1 Tax=Thermoascus crustaceus TaxID=5088 RepID=UPI0037431B5E
MKFPSFSNLFPCIKGRKKAKDNTASGPESNENGNGNENGNESQNQTESKEAGHQEGEKEEKEPELTKETSRDTDVQEPERAKSKSGASAGPSPSLELPNSLSKDGSMLDDFQAGIQQPAHGGSPEATNQTHEKQHGVEAAVNH